VREQLGVVAPEQHARLHATLGRPGRALGDERSQRMAGAREHRVARAQDERGAEVVGAIARVHHARVRAAPPQRLQLLALRARAGRSAAATPPVAGRTRESASHQQDVRVGGVFTATKKFKAHQ